MDRITNHLLSTRRGIRLFAAALLCCLLSLTLTAAPVMADVAPPEQPPGANPSPDGSTMVRMTEETVLISISDLFVEGSLGRANVTASFTMLNTGSETEKMYPRFPISANDGFFRYPEIKDLEVKVDGKQVDTSTITGELNDDEIKWEEFYVSFPPGDEVFITVTYTLEGTGEYPFISFAYLLETGAGWQGTIGSADIIVRLPYDVSPLNVLIDSHTGWGGTNPGGEIDGNEIRWHYDDLEPDRGDNFSISLVMPSAWKKVLTELEKIQDDPGDDEAWGRLAKAYKEISRLRRGFRIDPAGMELAQLSIEAYQTALELDPDDALWHAGYADHLEWWYYWGPHNSPEHERDLYLEALEEYLTAYTLAPDNPTLLEMLQDASYTMGLEKSGEDFIFTDLTQTPTLKVKVEQATQPPPPTSAPQIQPSPTSTGVVAPSPVRRNTPTPEESGESDQPTFNLCGSALLLPAGALAVMISARRKKRR